eukprot:PhF_6_TR11247/c0_g1_i1/m.18139
MMITICTLCWNTHVEGTCLIGLSSKTKHLRTSLNTLRGRCSNFVTTCIKTFTSSIEISNLKTFSSWKTLQGCNQMIRFKSKLLTTVWLSFFRHRQIPQPCRGRTRSGCWHSMLGVALDFSPPHAVPSDTLPLRCFIRDQS